ncbi:MAG: phosphate ABC transporter permease subunit PstC [Polyangiaceae bacterium]|nr:phosphate ABC transporter permease subunit PstC [Polyangiaceae bacterium]
MKTAANAPSTVDPPAPASFAEKGRDKWGALQGVHWGDKIFHYTTGTFAILVLALPLLMMVMLIAASRLSITNFGPAFLVDTQWDPVREEFGALPFIFGTVVSSLLALLLAVPVSLGLAIFLSELCPKKLRKPLGFFSELLAAIPSVVYGFWGIFVMLPWLRDSVQPALARWFGFLPIFQGQALGFGMLAAAMILAIMIVPTIASISRDVLRAVPDTEREAAIALGATPWETIRHAVLPMAKSGILGAVILGLNRALGETMAVTMVIGNRPKISASLFDPSHSMASVIANELIEAEKDIHVSSLSQIALLLFGVALVMNLGARWLVSGVKRRAAKITASVKLETSK